MNTARFFIFWSLFLSVFIAQARSLTCFVGDTAPPIMIDRARAENLINAKFPFDIDLRDTAGSIQNSAQRLAAHNGEVTVLVFWLTTCYPCLMEFAAYKERLTEWQKVANFRLIGISTDFPDNYPNFVKRAEKENWGFEIYHDLNREFHYIMPNGGLNGLPQVFVYDSKGELVYHHRRYVPGDEDELFEQIKRFSAKK